MISRLEGGVFDKVNAVVLPSPVNSSIVLSSRLVNKANASTNEPKALSVDTGAELKTSVESDSIL